MLLVLETVDEQNGTERRWASVDINCFYTS